MKVISFQNDAYRLTVNAEGESVVVAVGVREGGHGIVLTREQARVLHTELGEMLGRFVTDDQ
jgi:hypothetical protein